MIGYYVHHVGSGHVHRARAVAAACRMPVTGLSSAPRPEGWTGEWVHLDRDDHSATPDDVTADGHLHWAPRHDAGLRSRMALIASWLDAEDPDVMVSDVSIEVTLLARLHGVPAVSFVLPGDRTDAGHQLGYGVSDALVGCWPEGVEGMTPGLPAALRSRIVEVGALSRFEVLDVPPAVPPGRPRVAVLLGSGGGAPSVHALATARSQASEWEWTVMGPGHGWTDDVGRVLGACDVVVTQAGENALAEVASSRTPAVVVPADRPHDEQRTTARVLASSHWPAIVEPEFPLHGWAERLAAARRLEGSLWAGWCDGKAADRIADLLEDIVARRRP